ncbi:hypothetical protein Tco_0703340, partial [Tanacetum coccineum]
FEFNNLNLKRIKQLVNNCLKKDKMGSDIDFTNFTKNILKKDKITKADLEGPALKLMKGRHKNYVELEYNFEQCYLALSDQLDWVNPKGDRIPFKLFIANPLITDLYKGGGSRSS